MNKNLNMTEGKPLKLLILFALPLMFGNIFQQLYTVIDTAIVGRGVGMDALAALGTVDWFNWMMLSIATGFTQAFAVRVSQKFGEGDIPGMKLIIGQSAFISIVIAVAFTTLGQLGLPLFFMLLRVPDELFSMANVYTRILLGGLPAVVFFNYCSSVLRAVGDSKTPLIAMIAASITNIVLDIVAVFLLKWGIAGAAIATVFSQCLSGVVCAIKIWRSPNLRFNKTHFKPIKFHFIDLLKLGAPLGCKNIIVAVGGMAVQSIVNGFEMSFIAGFTATNKLYGLLEIAAISYGYAVTTYVGQNYGAANIDRIKSGMRAAVKLSLITAVAIAAIMITFGRHITMLFISSDVPELVTAACDTAYLYLCILSAFLPVLYMIYVYQSALQGMGLTIAALVSGVMGFIVRVGMVFVISLTGFEMGVFIADGVAWIFAALYLIVFYYRTMRNPILRP